MVERLRARTVVAAGGCWLWQGPRNHGGYAIGYHRGRTRSIHTVMWVEKNGPVPPGLQLDHTCRARHCVNPDHLEPVTSKENLNRGRHAEREKTHCPRGHPYDAANTSRHRGKRRCKACRREWQAAYYHRTKKVQRCRTNCGACPPCLARAQIEANLTPPRGAHP